MFIKTTAAQIRFLLKRNGAIITFFILLAMVLFNFISNVLVFQGKDVVEIHGWRLLRFVCDSIPRFPPKCKAERPGRAVKTVRPGKEAGDFF